PRAVVAAGQQGGQAEYQARPRRDPPPIARALFPIWTVHMAVFPFGIHRPQAYAAGSKKQCASDELRLVAGSP
ncbi:hypothetical protein, partial [Piscinibacter sp.]|uniref:hypothetical protein n=1 Tax=Piscinibacter sp. TaxID=1903157 RepID=UPI002CFADA14